MDLSESAEQLHKSGKTGLAAALLVLACEEIAKGHHFRMIADGAITMDEEKIGETFVFSKKVLYEHELKHLFAAASAIGDLLMEKMDKNKDKIESWLDANDVPFDLQSLLSPDVQKKFDKLSEEFLGSDELFQAKSDELRNFMTNMEKIKEMGFYVDISRGKVNGPHNVSESDYTRLLEHYDKLFQTSSGLLAGLYKSRASEFGNRVLKELAKTQTEPYLKKFKRNTISKKERRKKLQ